ncbi:MAG: 16S rRNA (guanine(527)-N(7))-methyltransferase RsmG [Legionella sp.]|jgi:16S rRNA (guanine527-N7)-methyltransferase|nr:16S rRNA (guanine(527)-N(7))-methyltransferase RsmG [Legionella sp.]
MVKLTLSEQLQAGFEALGLSHLDPEPFVQYLELLQQWNRAYNLTAVRDIEDMVSRHILDSLAIVPFMRGQRWLDVGTGPGLPGIPLALAHPDARLVLLDSNGKKIRFLLEVVRNLSLKHVEVIESRVESYHPTRAFDTVVSRAFSALEPMVEKTRHLIDSRGLWLAMKGRVPEDELTQLGKSYDTRTYTVPGVLGERCCILIEPSS